VKKIYLYVDDKRIPIDNTWIIIRDYYEFVSYINNNGLNNIEVISFDHDLGDVNNDVEKTGMDCAKFLINYLMDNNNKIPKIYVHSDNTVGSENIIKYINNWLKLNGLEEICKQVVIEYRV